MMLFGKLRGTIWFFVLGLLASGKIYASNLPVASYSVLGIQCQNAAVNFIDNSSTSGGFIVLWVWGFDDGSSSNVQSPSHVFSEAGDFDVRLTVIDSDGESDVFISTVTVQPAPVIDFSNTSLDMCYLTPQDFTSDITIASGGISGHQWTYGDGSISFGQNGSHSYSEPGIYTVTLTATSNLGCNHSFSREITIYDEPVAGFQYEDACLGNEVSFTNTSTIPNGNLSYLWNFGDGNTSTLVNPTHEYITSGNFLVTLAASSTDGGCETTVQHAVSVYDNPTSAFTADPVCFGDEVTFVNNSTGNNLQSLWNFGDGTTSSNFEPTHQYEAPGSYIATLQVTSADNCHRTSEEEIDVFSNPLPVFFTADQCLDNAALFSNLTNESTESYTYAWGFGDTQQSTLKNPEHTYDLPGTYTVALTATSASNCQTTFQSDIIISPLPVVDFSIANGCDGVNNTFVNESEIASGSIVLWAWNFGDGSTSSSLDGSHTYQNSGTYEVTLTATSENACLSSSTQEIIIFAKPVTDFSFSDACNGNLIDFTNNSAVSEGFMTYLWDFGDGWTSPNINPSYEYQSPGIYTVSLQVSNNLGGCTTTQEYEVAIFENIVSAFAADPVCFGDEVTFVNNSNGNNLQSFWNFGDGTTSINFEPTHQYEAPGSYVATLQVTSADNCVRTSETEIDVYPNPLPVFFTADQCLDNTARFSNLTNESTELYTYSWDFGDTQQSTLKNPEHTYGLPGTYTVALTATSASNCQTTFQSDIVIYPLPVVDFDVVEVCDGDLSIFTNLSEISSGDLESYVWDFGDLTNSTAKDPYKQYLNPGTYDVTLTVASARGCVEKITKQAVVHPLPIANFEVTDVCFNEDVVFSNTSVSDAQLSYLWDFGDGSTSIVLDPTHLYSSPGIYEIQLTAISEFSCENTILKSVIVYPSPVVSAGADVVISRGASAQLLGTGGEQYNWAPLEGLSNSDIANPIARPFETTDYIVTVTDRFGCQNQDTVRVELREDFKVVANNIFTPDGNGQNDFWVVQNAEAFDQIHVRVFDRYGKTVFEDPEYENDWAGTVGKDILPDGTYYYVMTFPGSETKYNGSLTIMRNK